MKMRQDAQKIICSALEHCQPDNAVRRALAGRHFESGRIFLVSIGKAAWSMANCCAELLGKRLESGIVLTKYGHSRGSIPGCTIFEGGHPIPDNNCYLGTRAAMDMVQSLTACDTVIFLISGGGSALFECPLISEKDLVSLTNHLLACGADITEINTIRKRLSAVKGGRFAQMCAPAKVFSIVLSDVVGDPLDVIASGPAFPDSSTCQQAIAIIEKYNLPVTEEIMYFMSQETPKSLSNVETVVTGNVNDLCHATAEICKQLGYESILLTDCLCCQAKEAGSFLSSIAKSHQNINHSLAYIVGGETVVLLHGKGKGGRNQELALSAAVGLRGLQDTMIFSLGSDGTDGPTDAAGGIVDGDTFDKLAAQGFNVHTVLCNNDAYSALKAVGGLIMTGPTGTNVNDVSVLLIKR